MAETLNIAALAQRTGVPAHTLRKWEERYRVLTPARTPGGQRRYSERDVARVDWLRDRLRDGYRIGEAARLLGTRPSESPRGARAVRAAALAAVRRGDHHALESLLDQSFAVLRLEQVLVEVVTPLLQRIGQAWERGEASVADEHLVTAGARAQIERLLADPRGGVRGAAVLACAPQERHELGLMMVAAMMRADGWNVAYLGADTPFADAVRFAARTSARLLLISLALEERIEQLAAELTEVDLPPGLELVVGGAAATRALARSLGARFVGRSLGTSIPALRSLAA